MAKRILFFSGQDRQSGQEGGEHDEELAGEEGSEEGGG
jgi:hypothetical protein